MAGQKKTLDEKRALLAEKEKKVRQALAKLQKEKARLSQEERKARNGELIAAGLLLVHMYGEFDQEQRDLIKTTGEEYFASDKRNLPRFRSLTARLDTEKKS